jgi:hypothetical protein
MGLRSLAEKAAVIRYFGDNALAIDRIEILYLNAYLLRLCANFLCGGQPRGVCCWPILLQKSVETRREP